LKKYKLWVNEGCLKLFSQRKQARLQWLQDPSEINEDNRNNVRHEASKNFRNKMKKYLKGKINELTMNSKNKNKNIREQYRGINEFKRGNLMMDENGDLLADSHNILNKRKNYFSQLLNVHRVSDVRQVEIHTAEPIAKVIRYKSPGKKRKVKLSL
jgi:glucan phosphorylase